MEDGGEKDNGPDPGTEVVAASKEELPEALKSLIDGDVEELVVPAELLDEIDESVGKTHAARPVHHAGREVRIQRMSTHQGPMPDAETLAKYEDIYPGAAAIFFEVYKQRSLKPLETIDAIANADIVNATKQTDANIANTNKLTDAQIETSKLGQKIAMALAFISVIGSIVLFVMGNNLAGGILLGVPAVVMITSFLRSVIKPGRDDTAEKLGFWSHDDTANGESEDEDEDGSESGKGVEKT